MQYDFFYKIHGFRILCGKIFLVLYEFVWVNVKKLS